MQRLTDGDLLVDVKEEGSHELRALSRAVLAFRDESERRRSLEKERERTNEELRRHRQELEALVEERTSQLSEINARLQSGVTSHAEARSQAESASRAKSEFLATMSHEIRTPMTGMLGMLRVLSESTVTRKQREQLVVARHSGEALLSILNSILDYSKIESGKISVDPTPFNLREALVGIKALMQPALQRDRPWAGDLAAVGGADGRRVDRGVGAWARQRLSRGSAAILRTRTKGRAGQGQVGTAGQAGQAGDPDGRG